MQQFNVPHGFMHVEAPAVPPVDPSMLASQLKSVRPFNPKKMDANTWANQLEDCANAYCWTHEQTSFALRLRVEDEALAWVGTIPKEAPYTELKRQFLDRFADKQDVIIRKILDCKQKDKEGVKTYIC